MDKLLCHITQSLPQESGAPEWIQLLPAGTFSGVDGRGPFSIEDMQKLIAASGKRKFPIDENHSTDLVGVEGQPSPARGWIVELQSRDDGLWGKVEWTNEGRKLIEERAYGFISPVLLHTKAKPYQITRFLRAALTNDPNFDALKSLHKRNAPMNEALLKLLGLDNDADDAAISKAVTAHNTRQTELANVLATMGAVRKALGVDEDANTDDLVKAINAVSKKPADKDNTEITELQDQIKSLNTQLVTLASSTSKDKATSIIDAAIEGKRLVPSLRDHYIARHMKDPDEVEKELKLMPSINAGGLGDRKLDDKTTISGTDDQVCQMMGLDPKEFAKTSKQLKEMH